MSFLSILLLSFAVAYSLCILVFIFYITVIGFAMGAPFAISSRKEICNMLNLAQLKKGELLLDLGSGDGSVLIEAAKKGARAVGIEINPFLVLYSRLRVKLLGISNKVTIKFADFNNVSLKDADLVCFYLLPNTVQKLKFKLKRELKTGTRIISKNVTIKGWTAQKSRNNIFLYALSRGKPVHESSRKNHSQSLF